MKAFKTPRVDKDIVGHLHHAAIAEAVSTDTFYTGDHRFPYAQVFVDRVSRYGDVIPLRSRTEVGAALVTFVCRHFTPLVLISDNIMENVGGDLVDQCRMRDIKQVYTCPYHPQMDFAEGYIGRITTMASFAMVYSGAPLFMWIWAVATAVFINNIMAAYYSVQKVWATPYELQHGEPFPDASIVVPFGCGVLVLLTKGERAKFKSRCALMVFVHYAEDRPLYTYAVYSPLTKRVLMRQDCIFLPTLFPMRAARSAAGMHPDGEPLVPIRSPVGIREGADPGFSFDGWVESDPLPEYVDHVHGHKLTRPQDKELVRHQEADISSSTASSYYPSNPSFGEPSVVAVKPPPRMGSGVASTNFIDACTDSQDGLSQADSGVLPDGTTLGDSSSGECGLPEAPSGISSNVIRGSDGNLSGNDGMDPSGSANQVPLSIPDSIETLFMINLEFPGQNQPSQRYRVSPTMSVRRFYHLIAANILECADDNIRIYVDDECLMHFGTVTDRHYPGDPTQLTVYLYRECVAQVRRVGDTTGGALTVESTSKPGPDTHGAVSPEPLRRTSTRVSSKRGNTAQDPLPTSRRAVRDRWFYEPVPLLVSQGSSGVDDDVAIPSLKRTRANDNMIDEAPLPSNETGTIIPVSRRERATLRSSSKEADTIIQVSRHERATLLIDFKRCQRMARRRYRGSLQALWDAEIADEKENGSEAVEDVDPEDEAEAWENYLFDRMMRYDEDSASQLVAF
jgi:hypothetical protein